MNKIVRAGRKYSLVTQNIFVATDIAKVVYVKQEKSVVMVTAFKSVELIVEHG